jgi:hypothetical protein
VRLQSLGLLTVLAIGLASCSKEAEYTDQERACIAEHRLIYDPKQLSQCVDMCKACLKGTTVTCTTSCTLKGAT